jgi:hypothetical protein
MLRPVNALAAESDIASRWQLERSMRADYRCRDTGENDGKKRHNEAGQA